MLSSLGQASAQSDFREGFIINSANDTIYGLIDYRGDQRNSRVCRFKPDIQASVVEFLPGEISGYRFNDGKYYVSKKLSLGGAERMLFVQYILNGIADLYYYRDETGDYYLIEKEGGDLIRLDNEKRLVRNAYGDEYLYHTRMYIGQLKTVFIDYPGLLPRLDNLQLKHKSLIEVTKTYHDYVCNDNQCIVYEAPAPVVRTTISPVIEYGQTQMRTNYPRWYSEFKFEGYTASAGVAFDLTAPVLNDKLSLGLTLTGGKSDLQSNHLKKYGLYVHDYTLDLEYFHLENRVELLYTYPKGRLRPSFSAGFINNLILSAHHSQVADRYLYEDYVETIEEEFNIPHKNYRFGYKVGAGFKYILRNGRVVFVRGIFQNLNSYLSPDRSLKFTSFTAQAGWSINRYAKK